MGHGLEGTEHERFLAGTFYPLKQLKQHHSAGDNLSMHKSGFHFLAHQGRLASKKVDPGARIRQNFIPHDSAPAPRQPSAPAPLPVPNHTQSVPYRADRAGPASSGDAHNPPSP